MDLKGLIASFMARHRAAHPGQTGYIPRYGSYTKFREQFRDDEARILRAVQRRSRKATRGNGFVYTPPAQLRREHNRGRSHARYVQ